MPIASSTILDVQQRVPATNCPNSEQRYCPSYLQIHASQLHQKECWHPIRQPCDHHRLAYLFSVPQDSLPSSVPSAQLKPGFLKDHPLAVLPLAHRLNLQVRLRVYCAAHSFLISNSDVPLRANSRRHVWNDDWRTLRLLIQKVSQKVTHFLFETVQIHAHTLPKGVVY